MKKRVMNIRPQEVTEGGERSVQYKGSDGKQHSFAESGKQQPMVIQTDLNQQTMRLTTDTTYAEIRQAMDACRLIVVVINGMGYAPVVSVIPQPDQPQVILAVVIPIEGMQLVVNILAKEGQPTVGAVQMGSGGLEPGVYLTADEIANQYLSTDDAEEYYIKKTDALAPVNGFSLTIVNEQEFNQLTPQDNVIYIIQ